MKSSNIAERTVLIVADELFVDETIEAFLNKFAVEIEASLPHHRNASLQQLLLLTQLFGLHYLYQNCLHHQLSVRF